MAVRLNQMLDEFLRELDQDLVNAFGDRIPGEQRSTIVWNARRRIAYSLLPNAMAAACAAFANRQDHGYEDAVRDEVRRILRQLADSSPVLEQARMSIDPDAGRAERTELADQNPLAVFEAELAARLQPGDSSLSESRP